IPQDILGNRFAVVPRNSWVFPCRSELCLCPSNQFSVLSSNQLGGTIVGTAKTTLLFLTVLVLAPLQAVSQDHAPTTAESIRGHFASVNRKILAMAKDFPEDKYEYKLKPEMRPFGALIVHIASGNVYAAKAGRGEKVNWDELDPKNYKTKAAIVALMEKTIADANATLKGLPDTSFSKAIEPWIGVTEHSAEHYGLLVGYYRANGIVPPASRPQK